LQAKAGGESRASANLPARAAELRMRLPASGRTRTSDRRSAGIRAISHHWYSSVPILRQKCGFRGNSSTTVTPRMAELSVEAK